MELKEKIIAEIKKIYDPEIPVNIYELGLIYDIKVDKDNKLLDKKLIKRYNDSALILTPEMTLEDELAEYLQFILGLNDKKVKEVLGVFHDYT